MKFTRLALNSLLAAIFSINVPAFSMANNLAEPHVIYDFESGTQPSGASVHNAQMQMVSKQLGVSGQYAVNVKLKTQNNTNAGFSIIPKQPFDWRQYRDFHLAFDIANAGSESVELTLGLADIDGASYSRSFVVPAHQAITVYAKMDGHDQFEPSWAGKNEYNFESGFRSNPPTWQSDEQQVMSLWGKKRLNLAGIKRLSFSAKGLSSDREFTIDNLRLRANPKMDEQFLVGVIDQFGQNAKVSYPGKVHSVAELIAQRDEELASLSGELMSDRSTFSGWKNGPRFEATGYFRTQKVNGKWWLVDPQGYLYLSTGVDIIRLSNSSTMTGYDFDQQYIPKRTTDMTVAEDDQPLNAAPAVAWPSRYVANDIRANVFEWLPSYTDPLGNHFGYRRESQSGPLKHGETYSFYSANLERKYGEIYRESYLDTWRAVTVNRMLDWGFTSLGNWAQEELYGNNKIPFVAFADIIGDFDTLSSGFDFWHGVPDPWDPKFKERAVAAAKHVAGQINNSPWCMGVFLDNEQSFGRNDGGESQYGIIINTLRLDAKNVFAKAEFTQIIRNKYGSIEKLNKAWNKNLTSWDDFADGLDAKITTEQLLEDYSTLLYAYGDMYFGTVKRALSEVLPNHMYLGSRFPGWGRPMEIVESGSKHMDVITYNVYDEALVPSEWAFMEKIDAPALVGEFAFGSTDRGHVHGGLSLAADQKDRGLKLKHFIYSMADSPYFVGAHMFQYSDSPIPGRAYDGENYNNGIVSVTDTPYVEVVDAAKEMHQNMYERRYFGAHPDDRFAQSALGFNNHRIAISADGNHQADHHPEAKWPRADEDDWAGTAATLAILAKKGMHGNLVHYSYNNFVASPPHKDETNYMADSVNGAIARWNFDPERFFDVPEAPDIAINHLVIELAKSTIDNPLYYIHMGTTELFFQAVERVVSGGHGAALEHVFVISHSGYNDNHLRRKNHHTMSQAIALSDNRIKYHKIKDQNACQDPELLWCTDDFGAYQWLQDHADESLNWLWERMQHNPKKKADLSDAGMLFYLVEGDENGSPEKFRDFLGDGI